MLLRRDYFISTSSNSMATIIYARKSSESEDRQVQSLADQVQALQRLAERESIKVTEVITEARSARTPHSRPEFERLIMEIEKGKVDGVLTWAVNRLCRNLVDGGNIAHLLQTGKLRFIRTPDRTYLPEDNAVILSVETGVATAQLQDLSRNVKRGLQSKVERGDYHKSAPIGYKNNLATHGIEPDPETFSTVRKAFQLLLSGQYSVAEIHRELVALGLKGMTVHSRSKPVSKSVVYNLLRNRFYTGQIQFNGRIYSGNHKPLISMSDFTRAQAILSRAPVTRPSRHEFPFAGTLSCGVCGCAVVGEVKTKHNRSTGKTATYTYYHCSGAKGCVRTSISEQALFEEITEVHSQLQIDEEFVAWCRTSLLRSAETDSELRTLSATRIEADLTRTRNRLDQATSMRLDGELSAAEFLALKEKLKEEEAALLAARAAIEEGSRVLDEIILNKLQSVVALSEPARLPAQVLRAQVRSVGSNHTLTNGILSLNVDPIIQKVAAFEPRANGSERAKADDYFAKNPGWLAVLNEARTIARSCNY